MNHKKNQKKLSRTTSHRASLIRNLCKSLIVSEEIKTTIAKAKTTRVVVEKLITIGREKTLNSRKKLISKLGGNSKSVEKILTELGPRYKNRAGGYTRIIKSGYRKGDCAPMAIIHFVR